jgi:hypothetical protein
MLQHIKNGKYMKVISRHNNMEGICMTLFSSGNFERSHEFLS